MPELFGQFVEVEPAQNVIKGFGAHVGPEYLSPALLEFAIADFADEGERAQLHQFVALAR